MKDRNVPYPVYPAPMPGMPPMGGMPCGPMPPMGGMPPMNNMPSMPAPTIPPMHKNHEMIEQKLASLDKRITHLENLVGSTTNYNASNFQVM